MTSDAAPARTIGRLKRPFGNLYYEVSGSGPALLFAHGLGGNHLSWWQQVAHFAPRYTCVTFAHRGFAPSDAVPGGPDAADYAGAAADFSSWVRAHGHTLHSLVKRRQDEIDLFKKDIQ